MQDFLGLPAQPDSGEHLVDPPLQDLLDDALSSAELDEELSDDELQAAWKAAITRWVRSGQANSE